MLERWKKLNFDKSGIKYYPHFAEIVSKNRERASIWRKKFYNHLSKSWIETHAVSLLLLPPLKAVRKRVRMRGMPEAKKARKSLSQGHNITDKHFLSVSEKINLNGYRHHSRHRISPMCAIEWVNSVHTCHH